VIISINEYKLSSTRSEERCETPLGGSKQQTQGDINGKLHVCIRSTTTAYLVQIDFEPPAGLSRQSTDAGASDKTHSLPDAPHHKIDKTAVHHDKTPDSSQSSDEDTTRENDGIPGSKQERSMTEDTAVEDMGTGNVHFRIYQG
jgi:hypothetical protein